MIGRTEISVLKETLLEQRSLLQKLQHELEAEREAADTSASEALSMILRLQGEKAELTLEASQYKRMAEEKMSHAEISLEIFEDLIYQKEMEVSSLEHQVEAYRCKLKSLGYSDMKHSGSCDAILQTYEAFEDDSNEMKTAFECDYRSQTPSPELLSDSVPVEKEVIEQNLDFSRRNSCQDLYEQIRKLDERVKEITNFEDCLKNNDEIPGGISKSYSFLSHQESEKSVAETCENHASSSKIHDIFEVPQTNKKVKGKEDEESSEKSRKNVKMGRKSCSKPPSNKKSRGSVSSNEHKADLQHLKARMERLECERSTSKREIARKNQDEDLKLLMREIKEQLNSVQSEMRSLRTLPNQSPSCSNDSDLLSVNEAMLYFWF